MSLDDLVSQEVDYTKISPKVWLYAIVKVFIACFTLLSTTGSIAYYVFRGWFDFEPIKAFVYSMPLGMNLPLVLFVLWLHRNQGNFFDYVKKNGEEKAP